MIVLAAGLLADAPQAVAAAGRPANLAGGLAVEQVRTATVGAAQLQVVLEADA